MNEAELYKELARNSTEQQIIKDELAASQRKWAEYALKHKDEINTMHKPIIVKKKNSARIRDFFTKIKTIFGLTKRKDNIDGIEAYLQYSKHIE